MLTSLIIGVIDVSLTRVKVGRRRRNEDILDSTTPAEMESNKWMSQEVWTFKKYFLKGKTENTQQQLQSVSVDPCLLPSHPSTVSLVYLSCFNSCLQKWGQTSWTFKEYFLKEKLRVQSWPLLRCQLPTVPRLPESALLHPIAVLWNRFPESVKSDTNFSRNRTKQQQCSRSTTNTKSSGTFVDCICLFSCWRKKYLSNDVGPTWFFGWFEDHQTKKQTEFPLVASWLQ